MHLPRSRMSSSVSALFAGIAVLLFWSSPAFAHVKWFAPYVVGAAPSPIYETLTNTWLWIGIGLALVFFLTTVLVERSAAGPAITLGFDRVTGSLWNRADDFTRVIIGAFFIAIFAVGGVYLTPDLKTPTEWVPWVQLLIAIGVFSQRTMKASALGILFLWFLALRDYEIFHLLDYLFLGLGAAGYLWLASDETAKWHDKRFCVLRWGVAIALMWSSFEKFAYPDWFYPLIEDKPFLTFGIPRDMFIPMSGVAEFTMGFGLLWTPLIRRLSAVALFVIFNAMVYPFGPIDLIGHALIMMALVLIMIDPRHFSKMNLSLHRALLKVPSMLLAVFIVIGGSYWGLHSTIYGPEGQAQSQDKLLAHTPNAEHSHGHVINVNTDKPDLFSDVNAKMHKGMMVMPTGDIDVDYIHGMIPHHQGAVDMSVILLKHGKDPETRELGRTIIENQKREIEMMRRWLKNHAPNSSQMKPSSEEMHHSH